jgi:hypothetical protein
MNRRSSVLVTLLGAALLVAGVGVYLAVGPSRGPSRPDPSEPEAQMEHALAAEDRARLPGDRVLLPAAEEAECRGVLVSGDGKWGVASLPEKSVLWDEDQRHLVVLLPNDKLTTLQERLTPA